MKAKNRLRHILTTAGELRLERNYHYCSRCGHGLRPVTQSSLFLRNEKNLSDEQREMLKAAHAVARKTSRAYRETCRSSFVNGTGGRGASRCRLAPVRRVAATLKDHLAGLLRWFDSRVTNALIEGFSSLVQSAKAAARGYRSADYMATMIYLRLGKLDLRLPRLASAQSI